MQGAKMSAQRAYRECHDSEFPSIVKSLIDYYLPDSGATVLEDGVYNAENWDRTSVMELINEDRRLVPIPYLRPCLSHIEGALTSSYVRTVNQAGGPQFFELRHELCVVLP